MGCYYFWVCILGFLSFYKSPSSFNHHVSASEIPSRWLTSVHNCLQAYRHSMGWRWVFTHNKTFCLHQKFRLTEILYRNFVGTFKLTLEFRENYPNTPPKVRFVSTMFHPNSKCCQISYFSININLLLNSIWWCKNDEFCHSCSQTLIKHIWS